LRRRSEQPFRRQDIYILMYILKIRAKIMANLQKNSSSSDYLGEMWQNGNGREKARPFLNNLIIINNLPEKSGKS